MTILPLAPGTPLLPDTELYPGGYLVGSPNPCLIYPWTVVYPWTVIYPGGLCPPVIDYGPGGGGFGAVMGRGHFERYAPRYGARYEAKYKSHLRKQKA